MFEISVALRYLIPRWKQLSVSIISLISILVISLVVWLIVLFFSVTDGLEKNWINKLVALTAPVRITPTQAYYDSYFYRIDSISMESDYTNKSIGEKLLAHQSDPYDPSMDAQIPAHWPLPDTLPGHQLKDPVKAAFNGIQTVSAQIPLQASDYEVAYGNLHIRQIRPQHDAYSGQHYQTQSDLTQGMYLGSLDTYNPNLKETLQECRGKDFTNLLRQMSLSGKQALETDPQELVQAPREQTQKQFQKLFASLDIDHLRVGEGGWRLPLSLLPQEGHFSAAAIFEGPLLKKVILPLESNQLDSLIQQLIDKGYTVKKGIFHGGSPARMELAGQPSYPLSHTLPLILPSGSLLPARLDSSSLDLASHSSELRFAITLPLQGTSLTTHLPMGELEVGSFHPLHPHSPSEFWASATPTGVQLPPANELGEPVLIARGYSKHGMCLGDRGYLSYLAPTASSVQEQRIPIYVAGFYDPGIIPMGGKFLFTHPRLTALVRSNYGEESGEESNGINVWMEHLADAERVKAELQKNFLEQGIAPYWKIETYKEFEFTRDLIQQLQSERNVFTLIAIVIIIVACSNIISMLIILVNDKKMEIGILRSMGASSLSIAWIFGFCGLSMGLLGGLVGTLAAVITLHHLQSLVDIISLVQGYQAFNSTFYGETLPNDLSLEALGFVFFATLVISLLAGTIPALKAARMNPSAILRSE